MGIWWIGGDVCELDIPGSPGRRPTNQAGHSSTSACHPPATCCSPRSLASSPSGTWYLVPCTLYLVLDTWYLEPTKGTHQRQPVTRQQPAAHHNNRLQPRLSPRSLPSTRYSPTYLVTGTWYLKPTKSTHHCQAFSWHTTDTTAIFYFSVSSKNYPFLSGQ